MKFFEILLKFLRQRLVSSSFTALSVAVGVALVAGILTLRLESEKAFSQKETGFELIVGAKGSPLQLVLNTMYHLGTPVGNFPLEVYEKLSKDRRVKFMLPMVFGDNVGGFKVIGTNPDLFTRFEYKKDQKIELNSGKGFTQNHEIVLGAIVAQTLNLKVGDSVSVRHGLQEQAPGAHDHGKMVVVGILQPTRTAIDKGVYCTMYTVWDVHYHEYKEAQEAAEAVMNAEQKPSAGSTAQHEEQHKEQGEHGHEIPAEFTSITSVAVKLKSPVFFEAFTRSVNEGTSAQAAMPIREIMGLFEIVGSINGLLLGISYLVIIIGAISIFVALYNSLAERRREIAILRSLGARRGTIFALIISEAVVIGGLGGIMGIILARSGLYLGKTTLTQQIGGNLEFAALYGFDALLIAGVIMLSASVSLLPAIKAYRTDVAQNLSPLS